MANKTSQTAPPIAAGQPEQNGKAPELLEIGELRSKHKIDRAIFAGVCSAKGWKPGKAVTEAEFLAAVKQFTGGPMSGTHAPESEARK